ncbi:1-phosphatidylinositol 3-phosphate 5-kinase-like isoform X3 [Tubulanus polymorphus]|uniref:1-phosphatidylinositol 3-phosphate 5-kinase-like isoform X3 n=1 Tax=Tubulanus polymorphus TaxID=672921 RepID=UPI003DA43F31
MALQQSSPVIKNERDLRKLTEFAPLTSDVKPSGFFSRFFKREKVSLSVGSQSDADNETEESLSSNQSSPASALKGLESEGNNADRTVESEDVSISSSDDIIPQTRNFSSVLTRLRNILDNRKGERLQAYKDSDFKQYWMPDDNCKECFECSDKFTTFRRRHHCRICGQIFCSRCCNQEVPGHIFGYTGELRVCTYCCKVVLSYTQQTDAAGDLQALREDMKFLTNIDCDTTPIYQEFGKWTPRKFRHSDEGQFQSRSGSLTGLTENTSFTNLRTLTPFGMTPQHEYPTMVSINYERKMLIQDSQQLKEIYVQLQNRDEGLLMQTHRFRLRTYNNCLFGRELVDWLIDKDKVATRVQAVAIGQALLDAKLLGSISSRDHIFEDEYSLYQLGELCESPAEAISIDPSIIEEDSEPVWIREISVAGDSSDDSSYDDSIEYEVKIDDELAPAHSESGSMAYVNNLISNQQPVRTKQNRHLSTSSDRGAAAAADAEVAISDEFVSDALIPSRRDQLNYETIPDWWKAVHSEHHHEDSADRLAYDRLGKAHFDHMSMLTKQLLASQGLALSWTDLILQIVRRVCEFVSPDVKTDGDDMDIRQYVQVKKIAGGQRVNSNIVFGVVCTKTVAHKKMAQNIASPKILLLQSAIEYQRVEGKLSSLDPQILQEHEYLKNCVAKIAALKPDILLVEKTVSRLAQDFILHAGITLVLNVKPTVMQRVARFTLADIVPSIDGLVSKPRLGICHKFYSQQFTLPNGLSKTLMFFDGCANHLGCTVTLRGGSQSELSKVKKILHFMVYVAYHSKLETSFIMDEHGMPPPHPTELVLNIDCFDDSSEDSPTNPIDSSSNRDESFVGKLVENRTDSAAENDPLSTLSEEMEHAYDAMKSEDVIFEENIPLASNDDDDERWKRVTHDDIRRMTEVVSNVQKSEDDDIENIRRDTIDVVTDISNDSNQSPIPESDDRLTVPHCSTPELNQSPKGLSSSAEITDFSDPLHNYQKSHDESIFLSKFGLKVQEQVTNDSLKFKKALGDTLLSISPYIKYDIPYLQTVSGASCELRKYFPDILYSSALFDANSFKTKNYNHDSDNSTKCSPRVEKKDTHPFVSCMMTAPIDHPTNKAMLADFRARGGQIHPLSCKEVQEKLNRTISRESRSSRDSTEGQSASKCVNGSSDNWSQHIDCLDIYRHQRLAVLFSSYSYISNNYPNPCINPWVLSMDYYGRIDFTLGNFLERFCFRESYSCPSEICDTPMVDHIRRFAHENGCIQIILRKVESSALGYPNHIVMWNWCRKCKKITPPVPMSGETWALSFAKYLELRFHGSAYTRRSHVDTCAHSLHHDHYQYFGFKQIVAAFKYTTIVLKEIALPPLILTINEETRLPNHAFEETKALAVKGHSVYSTIMEHLYKLKADIQTELEDQSLAVFLAKLKEERVLFREHIEKLQLLLTSPSLPQDDEALSRKNSVVSSTSFVIEEPTTCKDVHELLFQITDAIVELKRMIAEAADSWNLKISEFLDHQKKILKNRSKGYKESSTPDSISELTPPRSEDEGSMDVNQSSNTKSLQVSDEIDNSIDEDEKEDHEAEDKALLQTMEQLTAARIERDLHEAMQDVQTSTETTSSGMSSYSKENYIYGVTPGISESGLFPPSAAASLEQDSYIVCSRRGTEPDIHHHTSSSFKQEDDFIIERNAGEVDVNSDSDQKRHIVVPGLKKNSNYQLTQVSHPQAQSTDETDGHLMRSEKRVPSMKQLFSNFLTGASYKLLQPPFGPEEHHLIPGGRRSLPIVVYDQEPSSIIAFALSSHEYEVALQELKQNLYSSCSKSASDSGTNSPALSRRGGNSPAVSRRATDSEINENAPSQMKKTTAVLSFFRVNSTTKDREQSPVRTTSGKPTPSEPADTVKYIKKLDRDSVELDDNTDEPDFMFYSDMDRNKGPSSHVEVQFCDNISKFFCRVYYAEQFRQLRKLVFPYGEERYIRSLSRCIHWMARGGKSGSAFCKTKDNRFVLKQMSRLEMQSFVEFAPHYFQYITKAYSDQQPTVLAKILGVYRVGYRNSQTASASKQDLLVIENLFYGRKVSQVFDLKGSMRNRLVNTAGKREEELVLLDENLLKLTVDNPLYIRPHSKTVLTLAITSDTHFLSSHFVMDYSLLVGLDEVNKELVVGIIDYIRTFTWDKKLEMVVKSTGILGGQGKMPTVVSPELYRNRFLEAMERYFLLVPDRWSGLGYNVDS